MGRQPRGTPPPHPAAAAQDEGPGARFQRQNVMPGPIRAAQGLAWAEQRAPNLYPPAGCLCACRRAHIIWPWVCQGATAGRPQLGAAPLLPLACLRPSQAVQRALCPRAGPQASSVGCWLCRRSTVCLPACCEANQLLAIVLVHSCPLSCCAPLQDGEAGPSHQGILCASWLHQHSAEVGKGAGLTVWRRAALYSHCRLAGLPLAASFLGCPHCVAGAHSMLQPSHVGRWRSALRHAAAGGGAGPAGPAGRKDHCAGAPCTFPGCNPCKADALGAAALQPRMPQPNLLPAHPQPPVQGTSTTIYACVAPELENRSGEYLADCAVGAEVGGMWGRFACHPSALARDAQLARGLWDATEEMIRDAQSRKRAKPPVV